MRNNLLTLSEKELVLQDKEKHCEFANTFFDLHPVLISSASSMKICFDFLLILSQTVKAIRNVVLPSLVSCKTLCLHSRWWPGLPYSLAYHFKSVFLGRQCVMNIPCSFQCLQNPKQPAQHHRSEKEMKTAFFSSFWVRSHLVTLCFTGWLQVMWNTAPTQLIWQRTLLI